MQYFLSSDDFSIQDISLLLSDWRIDSDKDCSPCVHEITTQIPR